jgi:Ca-activated chloride channel family protein
VEISDLRSKLKFAAMIPALGLVWAQQPTVDQGDPAIFRIDTRLVVLHATAVDKDGHLITALPQSAFQIYENGVKQEIKSFRREDLPVSLGLVIDNSASMGPNRASVATAALSLVQQSNPDDEAFIVNFDENPSLDVDFTNDAQLLKKGLSRINSRGETAMRDAVRSAVEHLKGRSAKDKKALVVVTDGNDNRSLDTLEAVVRAAQQSEVLVYAVGLLGDETPREAERAKKALNALAQATGGQAYYPKDVSEIARIAPEIANEIRNQYTVTYSPSNQELDGSFRQIRVVVDSPGVTTIRTRTGYYATPDNQRASTIPGS